MVNSFRTTLIFLALSIYHRDSRTDLNADLDVHKPREARSLVNAVVNRNVQPQVRVRASTVEGRRVEIINGPYKGIKGNIDSCIPGNWYLIADLSKKNKFDLDLIVHAKNLKMLDTTTDKKSKRENQTSISHRLRFDSASFE